MTTYTSTGLSKSFILKGIQCPKALYLSKYPPVFETSLNQDLEAKFSLGYEVGKLAQQLFPGGTEVPSEGVSVTEQVAKTKKLIDSGVEIIYEASFAFDGIFIKTDILVKKGDAWEIHEVKMSAKVKDPNNDDGAVQYYVVTNSGLSITKVFLVHINNQYVRWGEIDVQQLFEKEDITRFVLNRQKALPEVISNLKQAIQGDEPIINIGPHCSTPYECEFILYCWQHIPEDSIFSLRGRGINKFDYYNAGIVRLEDLPLDKQNDAQRFQAISTIKKKDTTESSEVKDFLDSIWYPLCHLDFETFDTPAKARICICGHKPVIEELINFWASGDTLEEELGILTFTRFCLQIRESLVNEKHDIASLPISDTLFKLEPSKFSFRAHKG